ncbi:carboxypeptidase-like regulatory domain-containing protein [Caballeronia terrestris]|nr:carboxypeptidase-like regulatory domain-containing protein [Caballeronia terrestris]
MMSKSSLRSVTAVALFTISATGAAAGASPPVRAPDGQPPMMGTLLSNEERADFCTQMQSAATPEERRAVSRRMHQLVAERSREQGVALPGTIGEAGAMMGSGAGAPGPHMQGMMGMGCGPAASRAGTGDKPPPGNVAIRKYDGIPYVTGGVGEDEATAFKRLASSYNTRATFVSNIGEYLSGVTVQLRRADGTLVFSATSDGPYLFARLPQGRYRLNATSDGVSQERSIDVPKSGGVSMTLTWPTASRS